MKNIFFIEIVLVGLMMCSVAQKTQTYTPKINKEKARDIGMTLLKKVNINISKDDAINYSLSEPSQWHFPYWYVRFGGKASMSICAESGRVLVFNNLSHFYDHVTLKKHQGLPILWNEAQATEAGKKILRQLGVPQGLTVGRSLYFRTGETGPTAEVTMSVSKGGFTVKGMGWYSVIFDLHDGTVAKYYEHDKPVIESVTKKFDYKELLPDAKQTYEKYKDPLIVTDGLRKFTKARLELQRSDLTRPMQGPSKHVKGIAKYRLAWIFDFGGDYVAMDAETGKAMAVGYKPRPWKPRKPLAPSGKSG